MRTLEKCASVVNRAGLLIRALKGDPQLRTVLARRIVEKLDPSNFLGEPEKTWLSRARQTADNLGLSAAEVELKADRLFVVQEVCKSLSSLKGEMIEFGVNSGVTASIMLHSCHSADYWGVDSFEGLSQPDPLVDGTRWAKGELASPIHTARDRLAAWSDRVNLVKGWIPECLGKIPDELRFKFVHLDLDLYEPTRASLFWVAPKVTNFGVVICDDSGFRSCPGATRAVNEFMQTFGDYRMFDLPTGQSLLMRFATQDEST